MTEKELDKNFKKLMHLTDEENEEIRLSLPQFMIYRNITKKEYYGYYTNYYRGYNGYCTACRQIVDLDETSQEIKHRKKGKCPSCGADITFLAGGKVPAKSYWYHQNYAVFRELNGDLYIYCVKAYQGFRKDMFDEWNGISEYDVDYWFDKKFRYYLGPGESRKWKFNYVQWEEMKSHNEPTFGQEMGYNSYPDKEYIATGLDHIDRSRLKYSGLKEFMELRGNHYVPLIYFLCEANLHPQYEKLLKCGFGRIVEDRIFPGAEGRPRINLRADSPAKVLRLNSEEMNALRGCSGDCYSEYIYFRKHIKISGNFKQRFERFERFHDALSKVVLISNITELSHEKVMNYCERQKHSTESMSYVCKDWIDYLAQCRELEYDVKDGAINHPKNLAKAHGDLSRLIKQKEDEELNRRLRELSELRAAYEFESEEFIVIQPESVGDIVAEGNTLSHCVGGYADRHARGELHIMFLRKKDDPKTPFYTIEISINGKIQQCRGYANNTPSRGGTPKPQEIKDFEKLYQAHLDAAETERKKSGKRKKAKRAKKAA